MLPHNMASPPGLSSPSLSLSSAPPELFPLMSTTASVGVAIFEAVAFRGFVKVARLDKPLAARSIALWWKSTVSESIPYILLLGAASLTGGIRAIRKFEVGSSERYVAVAGTLLAVGHFVYGPTMVKVIQGMAEGYDGLDGMRAKKEESRELVDDRVVELQRRWLRIHAWRSFTVDVPAMLCFVWLALRA